MKLSEENKSILYDAISHPIMSFRINIQRHGSPQGEVLDRELFYLEQEIWRRVHKALNLKGPA